MKIKLKESKYLKEESLTDYTDDNIELNKINPMEYRTKGSKNKPKPSINNDAATVIKNKEDVIDDLKDAAEDNNKTITDATAEKEATKVLKAVDNLDLINPYGGATLSAAENALQRALDIALAKKRNTTYDEDGNPIKEGSPSNVLLYGLAGFGKTAVVSQFVEDHPGLNLHLVKIDAKSLDKATVGGIPALLKDKEGQTYQYPVGSSMWKALEEPNVILFLDELNRATTTNQGILLTLINEHELPIMEIVKTKDGEEKIKTTKYYPNILFTVAAINPASDAFSDIKDLDTAMNSRFALGVDISGDKNIYLKVLDRYYTKELNKTQYKEDAERLQRQWDLGKILVSDPQFQFDDYDSTAQIEMDNKSGARDSTTGKLKHAGPLNYRSMSTLLDICDGTPRDLKNLLNSGSVNLTSEKIKMILGILNEHRADFDKKGNKIFNSDGSINQNNINLDSENAFEIEKLKSSTINDAKKYFPGAFSNAAKKM